MHWVVPKFSHASLLPDSDARRLSRVLPDLSEPYLIALRRKRSATEATFKVRLIGDQFTGVGVFHAALRNRLYVQMALASPSLNSSGGLGWGRACSRATRKAVQAAAAASRTSSMAAFSPAGPRSSGKDDAGSGEELTSPGDAGPG